jgi:hypothetical protein
MKRAFAILIGVMMLCGFVFAQDRETEARKTYLEASQAVRSENYKEAERLLKRILAEYSDTEVALKADELLNSITGKLRAANLPKVPGFYVLLKNGDLVQVEKLLVNEGFLGGSQVRYATFKQEAVLQVYADEPDRFYIYNPKASLSQIKWAGSTKEEVPKGAEPTDNWIIFDNWYVRTEQGQFNYDDVVYNEVKPGFFEIVIPANFSPTIPTGALLMDGSPYLGVVVIQPKMVNALYPLMEFWGPSAIGKSQQIVNPLLRKYPNKAELYLFSAILSYKNDYKRDKLPTEAKELALKGLQLGLFSTEVSANIIQHLKDLLRYCCSDSLLFSNAVKDDDTESSLLAKQKVLSNLPLGCYTRSHKEQMAIASNYAALGDYNNALLAADKAIEIFKKSKPKKPGLFRVQIQLLPGEVEKKEPFSLDKALIDYESDIEFDLVENFKKNIQCEQILAQVRKDYIDAAGDPNAGLKLIDKAKDYNKNNIVVYQMKAQLLQKIGKEKDAEKALKEIDKAEERIEKERMKRLAEY